jgi:hypothetical protein
MAKVTKEFEEVELPSGKVVDLTITVTGTQEHGLGADIDGRRGQTAWLKDKWSHKANSDEDLDADDEAEIAELVEEYVQNEFDDSDFETIEEEVDEYETEDLF